MEAERRRKQALEEEELQRAAREADEYDQRMRHIERLQGPPGPGGPVGSVVSIMHEALLHRGLYLYTGLWLGCLVRTCN